MILDTVLCMTLNAHNQRFSIHRDLLFAKYGKCISSGCLSNSIQNLIKDCLGQLQKVRLSLSEITCQNTHCRGCQRGDWIHRLKLLPWAFLCSTEVLKFLILLFIRDVLLVGSSSGQLWWIPGLGPLVVLRRKYPLNSLKERRSKIPTITIPEKRGIKDSHNPRAGRKLHRQCHEEQGVGVFCPSKHRPWGRFMRGSLPPVQIPAFPHKIVKEN